MQRPGDDDQRLRLELAELRAENARLRAGLPPGDGETASEAILDSATSFAIFTTDARGLITSWNEGARIILGWTEDEARGRHTDLIFTPEDCEAHASEREREVATARGSAEDERWHLRKDGSRFFATGLLMPMRDGSGGFVKILRDRTGQLNAERNQLRRLEQMKALSDAARTIVGAPDLATTLQAITDAARDIVGAHQAVCSMSRGPEWSQSINAVSLSEKYAAWKDYAALPDGSGIYAWLCEGNRTVRMTQAQLEASPRWRGFGRHAPEHPPVRGWLATALMGADGRNLALIQLSDKIGGEFDEVDEAMVVQLAQFAASAIERAQAAEEVRAAAEFNDRILAASSDCIKVLDLDGRLLFMSAGGHAAMEVGDFERIRGRPWPEFWNGADRAKAHAALATARAGGIGRFRGHAPTMRGTAKWWDVVVTAINGSDGRPERLLSVSRDITSEQAAHETIQHSEARFRAAVDAVQGVIWTNDAEGRMVGEQPAWAALTGQSLEEYQGFGWARAVHPDDAQPTVDAWNEAVRERKPFVFEHRVRRHDGAWRLFSIRAIPALDASGEIREWVGVHTDVTDAREGEQRLRESERRLRATQENVPVGIHETDAQGHYLSINGTFTRLSGYTMEDFAGRSFLDFITDPADREQAARRFDALVRGEVESYVEERHYTSKVGRRWWAEIRTTAVRDEAGRFVHAVRAVQDITDRKEAEARLRELNATLEQRVERAIAERDRTWNFSQDLLLVTDPQGTLRAVNPAWTRVLGWRPDEIAGRNYLEIVHPDDHAATRAALARASREPLPSFETGLLHRDGSVRRISFVAAPEEGLIYASGRDVTEERRKETALASAEDALRQAQKMEAVGQLTGGVAHDFNNLLTIIRSSTDLLRRPDLPDERRRRYVSAISDTVDRAAKLTGQLLAFARRQALKPEVFDVAERVRAVSEMLRTIVGSRIDIRTDYACTACFIEADPTQFDTALVNMAVNARDAMDGEGCLTIRIDATAELPAIRGHGGAPGAFVAVSLTDTGTGIAPEQISQIFEPFFTTKEVGKGTGLGLSQVYGFAKQSGGDVAVESSPGHGTTFTIYLPRVEAEPSATGRGAEARGPEHGRGRRVLVVEDNHEVGEFSTQLLHDLGYETTWAANASEALDHLARDPLYDVVFSDVVMPGMSGVELGQAIRSHYPGLPVILTSGYSHVLAEDARHGFELLHKPYAVEELSRALRRVSRRRRTD